MSGHKNIKLGEYIAEFDGLKSTLEHIRRSL